MLLRAHTWVRVSIGELRTRLREQSGAAAAEYGLLIALIAAVIITAVTLLGTNIAARFDQVAGEIGTP